jgi:O-antigen/teichoic acid export membrane protein
LTAQDATRESATDIAPAIAQSGEGPAFAGVGGRTARGVTVSTALSLAFRLLGIAIGMGTTAALARVLAPAGYGTLALALTLVTAAEQTADLGIAITAASRIAREDPKTAGRTLSTGLAIRTSIALVAGAGLVAAALAGAFGASGHIVAIVAIATPLGATQVLTAGSTARFRPEVASILLLVQGALWLGAVLLVERTGGDLVALAWCFIVVTLLQTAVGLVLNRKVVPLGRPSLREARHLFVASWPLAISAIAFTAYYRLDSVILFHARGATELGYYAAAYKFVDVASLAPTILVAPLLPLAATSLLMDEARRRTILSLATRTATIIGTGGALMLIALAPQLIGFVYGRGFEPAARPLTLLAIAFVGTPLQYVGSTILSALGKVRPIAVITVLTAVLSLGAQSVVSPRWGAAGAATVTACTQLTLAAIYCTLAARAMKVPLPLREMIYAFAAAAATIGVASLVMLPWIVEATLTAAVFSAALLALRVITVSDFRRVLARRML